jgi:hypothetical protein
VHHAVVAVAAAEAVTAAEAVAAAAPSVVAAGEVVVAVAFVSIVTMSKHGNSFYFNKIYRYSIKIYL